MPRSFPRPALIRWFGLLLATMPCGFAQKSASNTLTVNTRLIYVDVVVHDAYGRPVQGLTASDFTLKEDGKPQTIRYFQSSRDLPQQEPVSPASPQPAATRAATTGVKEFSNVPAASVTDPAATIVLLDLLNTPVSDQLYGIRQLIAFCKRLPPGHRVALFLLRDRLYMLQGFTGSSDQLVAAANRVRPQDLQLTRSHADDMQLVDVATSFAQAIGPSPGGSPAMLQAALSQENGAELAQRFRLTADAFQQIARASAGFKGRKNLVWLASNFPVGVGAQLEIDRSNQAIDLLDTSSLIGNLQIALYPVSLAGLQTEGVPASANGTGELSLIGGPVGSPLHPQANDTQKDQFIARNSLYYAMNDLAHDTGGEAFHGSNDIAGAVTRALNDGSQYYTLAYRPTDLKLDGSYRTIRLTLKTGGYHLDYRRGYIAQRPADGTRGADVELGAAMQPGSLDSSLLRLRADEIRHPGSPTFGLDVTLDPSDLSFQTDAAGHRHTQLLVMLAALPGTEQARPTLQLTQAEQILNLDLTPEQYTTLLHTGLHFHDQIPARFAAQPLRLGVVETGTHRLGTLLLPLPAALP